MMDDDTYARLREVSVPLAGNNVLLPVAVAVADMGGIVSAPEVMRELGGRLTTNRILEALPRLAQLGALRELPYPGLPHPRQFEVIDGPFWSSVIHGWATEAKVAT